MSRLSRLPLLSLAVLAASPFSARAQDAAAPAADAAPALHAPATTLGALLSQAGPVVWICAALGAVVVALAVDGFLKFRYAALVPAGELDRLQQLFGAGAYGEAWEFCRTRPSFLCEVTAAGLERIGRGRDAAEFALEDASVSHAVLLRTPLHYLSAIGVVAPMLGLAGTVLGMIRALGTLAQSGTGDYASLAGAIGQVLVSTEAGLAVAIPGFAFYYYFKARAQTAVLRADRAVFRLFDGIPYETLAGGSAPSEGEEL